MSRFGPDQPVPRRRRRFSRAGAAFLIVGLATLGFEFWTRLILRRLGDPLHWAILVCGAYFSLWGLTELTVGLWPRFSRTSIARHHFFLPVEGRFFLGIMIVLFIGSLLGRSNPLLLVFCCLAGPFVVNGLMIVAMLQKLSIDRILPARVMAGECFSVGIRLTNRKKLLPTWVMTVRDNVEIHDEVLKPEVLFVHVPRKGSQQGAYRLSIASRGRVQFGPASLLSRFPLGIVERGLQADLPGQLLVHPRIGRLAANWLKIIESTHDATHSASHVAQAAETFHRLREYQSGDDPRTIHWRTSARRNELMVREFRDDRDAPLVLLLDAWKPARASERDSELIELGLSFAATVCVQQLRSMRDAPVIFAATGAEWVEWNSNRQSAPIEPLLDGLAILEPSPAANWRRLIDFCVRSADFRQTILLVTSREETVRAEIDSLQNLSSNERPTVAAIRIVGLAALETSGIFSLHPNT